MRRVLTLWESDAFSPIICVTQAISVTPPACFIFEGFSVAWGRDSVRNTRIIAWSPVVGIQRDLYRWPTLWGSIVSDSCDDGDERVLT